MKGDILLHPRVSEKTMNNLMGTPIQNHRDGNRIEFVVKREANKKEIKEAFERMFEVKVEKVNTKILKTGKHAIIKLTKDYSAEDIAMRIGIF